MRLFIIFTAIDLLLITSGIYVTYNYESCLSDVVSFPLRECVPDIWIQIAGATIYVGIGFIPVALYFLEKRKPVLSIAEK